MEHKCIWKHHERNHFYSHIICSFSTWSYKRSPGSPKPHQVCTFMSEGMLCLVSCMKALSVISILITSKCRKMDSGVCQKCHTRSQRISLKCCHRAHILPLDISIQCFISKEESGKASEPSRRWRAHYVIPTLSLHNRDHHPGPYPLYSDPKML